jgi:hypothetical protein
VDASVCNHLTALRSALKSNMTEIERIVRQVMNEHAHQALLTYDERSYEWLLACTTV